MTIRKVFRLRRPTEGFLGISSNARKGLIKGTQGGMVRGIKQGEKSLVSRKLRDKNIKREDVAKHVKCCGYRMKI